MYLFTFLLWKESLNSDGKQCHQYQQNEQSPATFTYWTQKDTPYDVGNPGYGLEQVQECSGLNLMQ